ncbi:MAG: hypothetical protein EA384_05820 [Spirochaetaceae bacterium]|nr:MAG: hypothetical protein EA384_05820 [Spirochaetaceae bacterium]
MKARVVPVYFSRRDGEFDQQLVTLRRLFADDAEFLPATAIGATIPADSDAVVFPQLLGEAYSRTKEFAGIKVPILILTSEFGTVSMWDWEIMSFLESHGISTLAPYSVDQARIMLRAARVKSELLQGVFLIYQDNPGEGQQASIFKRFWWWEEQCRHKLSQRFGVRVEYRSYRELGERISSMDERTALEEWARWDYPVVGLSEKAIASAVKLYLTVKQDISGIDGILGVGINCLNESHFSDTTPCVAWNMLFDELGIMWACEADIVSLATKHILYKSLAVPTVMTNIYPFLMGMAALKHERIPAFPEIVDNPENHLLVAHCGYFALAPRSFCDQWCLRPSVLGIVNDNSHMMDARLAVGPITFAKLDSSLDRLRVMEGRLKGYAQYPGSDCLNGGVIEVKDGHQLMRSVSSHHQCIMTGAQARNARIVSDVFGLQFDQM